MTLTVMLPLSLNKKMESLAKYVSNDATGMVCVSACASTCVRLHMTLASSENGHSCVEGSRLPSHTRSRTFARTWTRMDLIYTTCAPTFLSTGGRLLPWQGL